MKKLLVFIVMLFSLFQLNSQCHGTCDDTDDNTYLGTDAGNSLSSGENNSFFGRSAGLSINTGDDNSFFGRNTGVNTTDGMNNSFFGSHAGFSNSASNNSFFGHYAGFSNIHGDENSFFGHKAGSKSNTGMHNSFFGAAAGHNNTTGTANTFFGRDAGLANSTGKYNIAIGYNAGPEFGTFNVDSTLYIDIKKSNNPLIYCQFNKDLVRINGEFEVMGSLAGSSSIHVKRDIVSTDPLEILNKIRKIPITTWAFIDKPGIRHIGPMAQDFYAAFGVGKNETTISTVDADGVALAAIQGLYQLLVEERERNNELERTVNELIKEVQLLKEDRK